MNGKKHILDNANDYYGFDFIVIGDDSSLLIDGIGNTCINQKSKLSFSDVLLVLELK